MVNDCSRRHFMALVGGMCVSSNLFAQDNVQVPAPDVQLLDIKNLTVEDREKHEYFMQKAIEQGIKNPQYPFGAVIADFEAGSILAAGVNASINNPTYHGEIVAINDYVRQHGNQGWEKLTLYTTGEPCSMCMSAIVWANIPRVVWASSISTIRESGIWQIDISATDIATRARSFYQPQYLIQGVLSQQTDALFAQRKRS